MNKQQKRMKTKNETKNRKKEIVKVIGLVGVGAGIGFTIAKPETTKNFIKMVSSSVIGIFKKLKVGNK